MLPRRASKASTYGQSKKGDIRIAVVDVVYDGDGRFSRTATERKLLVCGTSDCLLPHALPFFELIKSAISRFSARFGSKFCGSQALTGRMRSTSDTHPTTGACVFVRIYRWSGVVAGSPKPPKRSRAARADAASRLTDEF